LAKANSDQRVAIAQVTADKQVEISQNMYNKLTLQDEARIQHKQDMLTAEMGLADAAAGLLGTFAEDSKDVMRASIIAESAIGIAKMIIANKLANVAALATPQAVASSGAAAAPVIAMNNISTGIGIAANIAATAKALKTLGGGSVPSAPNTSGGGGGAAGGVMSANFNVVGNSGVNQLASLQQQPVQAYVVSGQITSQQSLDRNRKENATL